MHPKTCASGRPSRCWAGALNWKGSVAMLAHPASRTGMAARLLVRMTPSAHGAQEALGVTSYAYSELKVADVRYVNRHELRPRRGLFSQGHSGLHAIQLWFIRELLSFASCSDWRSLVHRGTARGCLSSPSPTPRAGSRRPHLFLVTPLSQIVRKQRLLV